MILTRLDEILKEKNISINKLSNETGISRNALTSLVNNDSKGIQFQTLEKLITYLNISIQDFFVDDREKLLLSILPITQVNDPSYNIEELTDEKELISILYLQSTWNIENENSDKYNSTPIIAIPTMREDENGIFGISFRMDNEDLTKEDIENFTYIFKKLNKDQLHYMILEFLNTYINYNKKIRTLLDNSSIKAIPVVISYFDFNDILIFNISHKDDGSLLVSFDFSSEGDEKEEIKIKISNIDLSKFTN